MSAQTDAHEATRPHWEVGARLARFRTDIGDRATAFAARLGVSQPTLSHWERGRRLPSPEALIFYASLGADVNWLLTGVPAPSGVAVDGGDDERAKREATGWRMAMAEVQRMAGIVRGTAAPGRVRGFEAREAWEEGHDQGVDALLDNLSSAPPEDAEPSGVAVDGGDDASKPKCPNMAGCGGAPGPCECARRYAEEYR